MKANPKLMTEMAARNDWGGIGIELKKAAMLEFELTEEQREKLGGLLKFFIHGQTCGIEYAPWQNEIELFFYGQRSISHVLTDEEAIEMLRDIRKDMGDGCKEIDAFLASTSVELP